MGSGISTEIYNINYSNYICLSQEFIPVLSGGAVVWGNLLEVAGGRPASTPISSLTLMKVFGEGPLVPFMGILQKAPPLFS